jgi:hypothetical protein
LNNEISNPTITPLDEEKRRKIIVDFISEHPGCNTQYVTNGVQNYIGRVKVSRILKDLKSENIVIGKRRKPNSREIQLYVNNDNLLVSVPRELEEFEKAFFSLLEKAKVEFEKRLIYIISRTLPSTHHQSEYSIIISLITQPLDIFHEMVNVYNVNSILLWPEKIQDKDTLKELYTVVFTKIVNMKVRTVEILRSLYPSETAQANIIILNAKFLENAYATKNIIEHHETFSKFGMQKEIESVLDSMSKIKPKYKENAYYEPGTYGCDFGEKDDWRRLIKLLKQHPD